MSSAARPMRGDIWRVSFGRPAGNEQAAGDRPALVISSDEFNEYSSIVVVAPITSAQRDYPSRVQIRPGGSGLRQASWAAVEHLRSISRLRLEDHLGAVEAGVMGEVERILDLILFDRN